MTGLVVAQEILEIEYRSSGPALERQRLQLGHVARVRADPIHRRSDGPPLKGGPFAFGAAG